MEKYLVVDECEICEGSGCSACRLSGYNVYKTGKKPKIPINTIFKSSVTCFQIVEKASSAYYIQKWDNVDCPNCRRKFDFFDKTDIETVLQKRQLAWYCFCGKAWEVRLIIDFDKYPFSWNKLVELWEKDEDVFKYIYCILEEI